MATSAGLRDRETYAIIGAAMEVHRTLGPGFLEAVYHEAMAVELALRKVPHRRTAAFPVFYRGIELAVRYKIDLVCFESVVVELKATKCITPVEQAQVINYLKASRLERGLLLNFGAVRLEYRRVALGNSETADDTDDTDGSSAESDRY